MRNKTTQTLFAIFSNLIHAYVKRITDLVQLAGLEARLAGKTLIQISILIYIVSVLLISTWFCMLLLLFIYLVSLQFTWVVAAFIITILNVALLFVTIFSILKIKRNLFFPATRRQLEITKAMLDKDT
jgi:uncharacterized membrane protein YqjE